MKLKVKDNKKIRDTQTKEIKDFRGFENVVFKQSKIFGINFVDFFKPLTF
jgi:hypothetical protein